MMYQTAPIQFSSTLLHQTYPLICTRSGTLLPQGRDRAFGIVASQSYRCCQKQGTMAITSSVHRKIISIEWSKWFLHHAHSGSVSQHSSLGYSCNREIVCGTFDHLSPCFSHTLPEELFQFCLHFRPSVSDGAEF